MNIANSTNMETMLNTSLTAELLKKKLDKKDINKENSPNEILIENKEKSIKTLLKGKSSKMLDELNKQKINPDIVEKALEKLKKEKEDDKKSDKIDIKDKNRDGKVSQAEKKEAEKKETPIDIKDKNKDGKVSFTEEQEFKKKKALKLTKKVIEEVKKDNDLKDIKPADLKNVSKMLNDEILDKNEAKKINSFLDN